MNQIKKLISKMSEEIKELGKRFPITMFLIVFVTILYTSVIDQNFSRNTEEWLEKIYLFCTIWGVGTFFTETIFVKKTSKITMYTVSAIISLIFTQILTSNAEKIEIAFRFLVGYISILGLLTIYQTIQKANLKWQEYTLKVFRDLFNTTATYLILNIGTILLTTIFVQLILDGHYGSIMERLFVLLFGLFYVPSMVYTISGISQKQVNSFIKGLVLYVLLPLTTIAIGIIYLYLAKIILLQDMPQNTIYRILAGIFIVAFPVWNMASNYAEEKKFLGKMAKILPYLYAPFLLLEIYSIGTRISGFGMTPMRYISCLFIVFQAIALVLTFYQKSKFISQICLYAAILCFIVFVSPWNYENVSNWSQKGILEKRLPKTMAFEDLENQDKDRVKSAYEYLKKAKAEKYLANVSAENKEKIEAYVNTERKNYDYRKYLSLECDLELDIGNYTKITQVRDHMKQDETYILDLEGRKVDVKEKIEEIICQNEEDEDALQEDFAQNHIVEISNTEDFYISEISMRYYQNSKKIDFLDVEGYILEK